MNALKGVAFDPNYKSFDISIIKGLEKRCNFLTKVFLCCDLSFCLLVSRNQFFFLIEETGNSLCIFNRPGLFKALNESLT